MGKISTFFLTLLVSALLPMSLSSQTCSTATRTAVDCKFGTPDAIGWAMQQFFSDGSTASWNFESGAVFQENADGSALLTGVITQYGSIPKRSFAVQVNFTGKSATTTGTPETNNLCPVPSSTSSWWYYTLSSGTLTGVTGTSAEGAKLTLKQHMMPSQYGIGAANQCVETNSLGLTGWFEYQIVSQPSNGWLTIYPYSSNPVIGQADICIHLSGTPTPCGNPCDTDVTPPVFANCPANITLSTDCNTTCAKATWTVPTATDNCTTPTVVQTTGGANGSCFNVGTTTVTYTATDAKGNKSTCSFTVTVTQKSGTSITRTVSNSTECSNKTVYGIYFSGKYYTLSNASFTENADLTAKLTANSSLGAIIINFTGRTSSGTPVYGSCFTPSTSDWYFYSNFTGTIGYNAVVSNPMHKFQVGTSANNQNKGAYGASGWWTGNGISGDINILLSGNTGSLSQITCPIVTPCQQPTTPYGYTFIGQYGNNFYYKYNGDDEKYSESKKRCEGYGGHLAYCKESGEGEFLKKFKYGKRMWLGLEYDGYNWNCGDGSKENFYNWGNSEPKKDDKDKKYCKMDDDGKWYASKDDEKGGAILILPCSSTPPPTCIQPNTPYGYTFLGQYGINFYYKYNGDDEKYSESKKRCEGYGGHLAYYKEGGEGEFLKKFKYGKRMWLGLEYDGYNWNCGDGSKENFYNWGNSEPKKDDKDKKYCKIDDDGKWYSSKDDEKGGAILVLPCVGTLIPHVCSTNDIDEKKYYKIRNKKSGKYLEVSNGSYNNYGEIKQNDYNGGDHQKWSAVQTTDGYYKFISYNSGKALSCYENWNGANLYQYDYYKGDEKNKDGKKDKNKDKYKDNSHGDEDNYKAEEWKVECDKDGYKFTHKMSGRVCNVKNGSSDKGEKLELRDYSGGDEERFQLEEVTQNLQNTKVLSLSAAVEPNRTRIEWVNNTGASNDFFQIEKLNTVTGVFETLENVKSLSSLDMEHYVSYDTKPIEGDNFYRINAISFDGSNNFSDVQKVNFKGLAGSLSIFPNPADEVLNIDLSSYKGSAVSLFVYNHLGQAVITQQIDKVSDGVIQIDISNQQMGNYLLRVYSKGKRDETKSFILNK